MNNITKQDIEQSVRDILNQKHKSVEHRIIQIVNEEIVF